MKIRKKLQKVSRTRQEEECWELWKARVVRGTGCLQSNPLLNPLQLKMRTMSNQEPTTIILIEQASEDWKSVIVLTSFLIATIDVKKLSWRKGQSNATFITEHTLTESIFLFSHHVVLLFRIKYFLF